MQKSVTTDSALQHLQDLAKIFNCACLKKSYEQQTSVDKTLLNNTSVGKISSNVWKYSGTSL